VQEFAVLERDISKTMYTTNMKTLYRLV